MPSHTRARRSIFDRLLAHPHGEADGLTPTCTLEQLRDAVAADLERLLNTRTALPLDAPALGPHSKRSMLSFGVPDVAARVLASSEDQRHIARGLAQAIEAHEPRLQRVSVAFQPEAGQGGAFQFTIRATLVAMPLVEGVSFDALVMPVASRYEVTRSRAMGA